MHYISLQNHDALCHTHTHAHMTIYNPFSGMWV